MQPSIGLGLRKEVMQAANVEIRVRMEERGLVFLSRRDAFIFALQSGARPAGGTQVNVQRGY